MALEVHEKSEVSLLQKHLQNRIIKITNNSSNTFATVNNF